MKNNGICSKVFVEMGITKHTTKISEAIPPNTQSNINGNVGIKFFHILELLGLCIWLTRVTLIYPKELIAVVTSYIWVEERMLTLSLIV